MLKKTMALVTLVSFLCFSWSCVVHSWRKTSLQSLDPYKRATVKISAVSVRSGEKVELRKNPAARIRGDSVVGVRLITNLRLEKSKIQYLRLDETGRGARFITTDGVEHTAKRILSQDDSSLTYEAYLPTSFLLSDIDFIWIQKTNLWATLLLDIALPVGILFAAAAAAMSGFNMSMGSWWGSYF